MNFRCQRRQCRQRVHLGSRRRLFLSFKFDTAARRSAGISVSRNRTHACLVTQLSGRAIGNLSERDLCMSLRHRPDRSIVHRVNLDNSEAFGFPMAMYILKSEAPICARVSASINPLPSYRLCRCDLYIRCVRSLSQCPGVRRVSRYQFTHVRTAAAGRAR